jgi:RHS repeat-associated protein
MSSKRRSIALLVTDQSTSVLCVPRIGFDHPAAYCPFGYHHLSVGISSGFNGHIIEKLTANYLLGNGYRTYNPALRRFHRPDSLCPFGRGGLNSYAYCGAEPVNRSDPTGRAFSLFRSSRLSRLTTQNANPVANPVFVSLQAGADELRILDRMHGEAVAELASTSDTLSRVRLVNNRDSIRIRMENIIVAGGGRIDLTHWHGDFDYNPIRYSVLPGSTAVPSPPTPTPTSPSRLDELPDYTTAVDMPHPEWSQRLPDYREVATSPSYRNEMLRTGRDPYA